MAALPCRAQAESPAAPAARRKGARGGVLRLAETARCRGSPGDRHRFGGHAGAARL